MARAPIRVCFVCLGNICRSPTAEGVMRRLVEEAGLSEWIDVDSAGTVDDHVGEHADRRAREAAGHRGIRLDGRAKRFTDADFATRHYVLAMDRQNLSKLEALARRTDYTGHLSLLRDFDTQAPSGAEVPDPYYGGHSGFEDVLDLCEAACRGLLARIRRDLDEP